MIIKKIAFCFLWLSITINVYSQIWINEYSYDCMDGLDTINGYNDGDEFIEIIAPVGMDMSNYGVIVFGTPPPYTETKILYYQRLNGVISETNAEQGLGFMVITTLLSHQLNSYTPIPSGILTNHFSGLGQAGLRNGYNAGALLVEHISGNVIHGVYSENNYSPKLIQLSKDPLVNSPGNGPYPLLDIDYLPEGTQDPSISLPLRGYAMIGSGFSRIWILTDGTEQSRNTPGAKNSNQSTLPVELSSLTAISIGNNVKLNWTTDTEVNNYGFEIERKSNVKSKTSDEWQKIGFVNGNGNSNSPKDYSFEDIAVPDNANTIYYRLKQIDNDGQYEYSKIIEVSFNKPMDFSLNQNFPNPFNPETIISWQSQVDSWQKLKIFDVLGNEVATLVDEFKPAGYYEINFNAAQLCSGIYFYQLKAGRFLETKKMIITK